MARKKWEIFMLVPMRAILEAADKHRYGQGAFNMNSAGQVETAGHPPPRAAGLGGHPAGIRGVQGLPGRCGRLYMHGSLADKQKGAKVLGGRLENAFGIEVAQLADMAKCGISKINVDTDIRLACTSNILQRFADEPELRDCEALARLYRDRKANPKNFDPRNYCDSIFDNIVTSNVPNAQVGRIVRCMQDSVMAAIAPLLVQFGSCRTRRYVEPVTCEQMAERYKKEGI